LKLCIGVSCGSCGGEIAVKAVSGSSIEQAGEDVRSALGGMFCVEILVADIPMDQIRWDRYEKPNPWDAA